MSELKRCPFCRGEAEIEYGTWMGWPQYTPVCGNGDCICNTVNSGYNTWEDAVAAWNRRADGWRPASEPPETDDNVLVWAVHGDTRAHAHTAWYSEGAWHVPWVEVEAVVTHWRHLPEPPKEEDDGETGT